MVKWAKDRGPVWVTETNGRTHWATLIRWYTIRQKQDRCRVEYGDGGCRTFKKTQIQPITGAQTP